MTKKKKKLVREKILEILSWSGKSQEISFSVEKICEKCKKKLWKSQGIKKKMKKVAS